MVKLSSVCVSVLDNDGKQQVELVFEDGNKQRRFRLQSDVLLNGIEQADRDRQSALSTALWGLLFANDTGQKLPEDWLLNKPDKAEKSVEDAHPKDEAMANDKSSLADEISELQRLFAFVALPSVRISGEMSHAEILQAALTATSRAGTEGIEVWGRIMARRITIQGAIEGAKGLHDMITANCDQPQLIRQLKYVLTLLNRIEN